MLQQQPQQLPPGWIMQFDPNSGQNFYVNTATGISQWVSPISQSYAPPRMQPPSNQQPMQSQFPARPQQMPQLMSQPGGPAFMPVNTVDENSTQIAYSNPTQAMGLVSSVDPTVAIALELKQSIPTLMGPPQNETHQNAYKSYIRSIQDAQNSHTRALRDAQLQHQKEVRDAEYHLKNTNNVAGNLAGIGSLASFGGMMNKISGFGQDRQRYNQMLADARLHYERNLEHAAQRLNDAVEYANRNYEDACSR